MIRRFLILGILLGSAAGCTKEALPPVKLNDRIAADNQKLFKAAAGFYKSFADIGSGKTVSGPSVKSSYDTLKKTFEEVQKDADGLGGTTSAGDDFAAAYRTFLQGQDKLLKGELAQIVVTIEAQGKTNAAKWQTIQGLLAKIDKAEKADLDTLKTAQKTFADSSGFQVPGGGGMGGPGGMPGMGGGGPPMPGGGGPPRP